MKKALDYHRLFKNWMEFYDLTAERSKKMFASIWAHLQITKPKVDEKGEKNHGGYLERPDRESQK